MSNKDTNEIVQDEFHEDGLEESAGSETLKPNPTRAEMLATFSQLLSQLKGEDLSHFFNDSIQKYSADGVPSATAPGGAPAIGKMPMPTLNAVKLAIESTVRADIAENFMEGLYNLFAESYITVPEEKLDVVGELKAQLEELEAKLDESVNKQLELQSVIDEATMEATFDEVTEGLAATQVEKLRTLAEGIEFTDSESYAKKLDILKGKYFSEKKEVNTGVISEEATEGLNEETKTVAVGEMANYVSAISRTKKF